MNEKHDLGLVTRPADAIEKAQPSAKRILASMVADTLTLAAKEKATASRTFQIGDYEWCEPDYRQILLWAKALGEEPEKVLERLIEMECHEIIFTKWGEEKRTDPDFIIQLTARAHAKCFQSGRLFNLYLFNWKIGKFEWVEGLELEQLHIRYLGDFGEQAAPYRSIAALSFPLPHLRHLVLGRILASEIDLTNLANLNRLELDGTGWKKLKLSDSNSITSLSFSHYKKFLGHLLPRLPRLRYLQCSHCQIETLELPLLPELTRLTCCRNKLMHLSLPNVPSLKSLDCSHNRLASLSLTNLPNLEVLDCADNKLAELDLSANASLVELDCSDNPISVLDIRGLQKLQSVVYDKQNTRLLQRPDQNF